MLRWLPISCLKIISRVFLKPQILRGSPWQALKSVFVYLLTFRTSSITTIIVIIRSFHWSLTLLCKKSPPYVCVHRNIKPFISVQACERAFVCVQECFIEPTSCSLCSILLTHEHLETYRARGDRLLICYVNKTWQKPCCGQQQLPSRVALKVWFRDPLHYSIIATSSF